MEPWLSTNDKLLFYKYLNNASVYFEYGSGGSTYQASKRDNISKIYSVESDIDWHNKLKKIISDNKIEFIYNEMDTKPNDLGKPGPNSTPLQKKNYSNQIRNLSKDEQEKIDLVFIDGRFRVACCLKCFDIIKDDCVIVFDDFLTRPEYHVTLDYYDIIESTKDKRLVVLKKKKDRSSVPKNLIEKYELLMR